MIYSKAHQTEVNRKASRIYKLIKANRDEEAELELRAFGTDAAAVADALTTAEFRKPNITLYSLRWFLIVLAPPIALILLLCTKLGTPASNNSIGCYLYFPGVCLVLAFAICLNMEIIYRIMSRTDERKLRNRSKYAEMRANELEARTLSNAPGASSLFIGGLLSASKVYPELEKATLHEVEATIARTLPLVNCEALIELNLSQRKALNHLLQKTSLEMETDNPRHNDRKKNCNGDVDHFADLGKSILLAYNHIADSSAISTVREISKSSPDELPTGWHGMIKAARVCLPILEDNVRRSHGDRELLSGSSMDLSTEEELLRPQKVNRRK